MPLTLREDIEDYVKAYMPATILGGKFKFYKAEKRDGIIYVVYQLKAGKQTGSQEKIPERIEIFRNTFKRDRIVREKKIITLEYLSHIQDIPLL